MKMKRIAGNRVHRVWRPMLAYLVLIIPQLGHRCRLSLASHHLVLDQDRRLAVTWLDVGELALSVGVAVWSQVS